MITQPSSKQKKKKNRKLPLVLSSSSSSSSTVLCLLLLVLLGFNQQQQFITAGSAAAAAAESEPLHHYHYEITGNLSYWDSIFTSRKPTIVLSQPSASSSSSASLKFSWTEGPVVVVPVREEGEEEEEHEEQDDHMNLIFSDTIEAKIFHLDVTTKEITVLVENSGNAPPEELEWRAEPGSNGLALLPPPPSTDSESDSSSSSPHPPRYLVVCQHGGRQIGLLDLLKEEAKGVAKTIFPLVQYTPHGKRFNGPNDIVVQKVVAKDDNDLDDDDDEYYDLFFTDPVYAWLEKKRFQDLPYLDDSVREGPNSPGYCGVYRVRIRLPAQGTEEGEDVAMVVEDMELVDDTMSRPNGIGFLKKNTNKNSNILVVADCCQGNFNPNCQQGTSRWNLYARKKETTTTGSEGSKSWEKIQVIEDTQSELGPPTNDGKTYGYGCADGFDTILHPTETGSSKNVLIASCSDGLCLVDVEAGKVVARLWTTGGTSPDGGESGGGGCKISNVAIAPTNDRVYLTGNCGILQLFLRQQQSQQQQQKTTTTKMEEDHDDDSATTSSSTSSKDEL